MVVLTQLYAPFSRSFAMQKERQSRSFFVLAEGGYREILLQIRLRICEKVLNPSLSANYQLHKIFLLLIRLFVFIISIIASLKVKSNIFLKIISEFSIFSSKYQNQYKKSQKKPESRTFLCLYYFLLFEMGSNALVAALYSAKPSFLDCLPSAKGILTKRNSIVLATAPTSRYK